MCNKMLVTFMLHLYDIYSHRDTDGYNSLSQWQKKADHIA